MSLHREDHWNPEDYEMGSELQQETADKLLREFPLIEFSSVLDIGCGDGRITALIATTHPNATVLGVDISKRMIDHATRKHSGIGNLRFEIGDAEQLSIDRKFDCAISFSALSWINDHAQMLQSVRAALRPGGHVLFHIPLQNQQLSAAIARVSTNRASSFLMQNPKNVTAPQEYERLLSDPAMHGVKLLRRQFVHRFESDADLARYIRGWLPIASFAGSEERAELAADVAFAYGEVCGAQGMDDLAITMDSLVLTGRLG